MLELTGSPQVTGRREEIRSELREQGGTAAAVPLIEQEVPAAAALRPPLGAGPRG